MSVHLSRSYNAVIAISTKKNPFRGLDSTLFDLFSWINEHASGHVSSDIFLNVSLQAGLIPVFILKALRFCVGDDQQLLPHQILFEYLQSTLSFGYFVCCLSFN